MAFSPDGRSALSASSDTTAILWDVATGEMIYQFDEPNGYLISARFSLDGHTALVSSVDGTIRRWVATPEVLLEWVEDNRYIPELTPEDRALHGLETEDAP